MSQIATKQLTTAGTAPTFRAAAASDTAECGPGFVLEVRNTNAATRTVTITVPGNNAYGQANPDPVYTVAADTGELRIPLLAAYRDPTDRLAHLTYSATTGVTVAVTKI
jgi:hypothetical protein